MKIKFLLTGLLILSSGPTFAGSFCSSEQTKRGCHTESYDCDRPTHYTCHRCVCPSNPNSNQVLEIFDSEQAAQVSSQENSSLECCTKTFCHNIPHWGRECFERTVCGSVCQTR